MKASVDDTRRFLSLLARPGDVFELRALSRVRGQQHVDTGYFDDFDELAKAAAKRSGEVDGVYITINPVNPALTARAPKNQIRRAGSGDTTSDRDVTRRRSILIDIDPVRPTGISSTNEEHKAALALAWEIAADMSELGWPDPIFADSGNGAHLIYAVDLPVDDGGLVSRVLATLSRRYTTPSLKVDEKVFNPARISKIYGTLTRKGENTPERPHRIARIIEAPDALVEVSREVLEVFAPKQDRVRTAAVESSSFRIDDFIAKYLPDAKERSWASGSRKWILPVCPFNDSHDRGEAHIEEFDSGALSAGCLHESCKWGWKDLRAKYEPKETNGHHNGHQRKLTDRQPPPEVLYEDERYTAELEIFAERDREQPPPKKEEIAWRRLPELRAAIWERAKDPWIEISVGGEPLARVRTGSTVVLMGGSGSGKSSLTTCILVDHAKNVGPSIALSIELPADELAARIVGQRCDASWEDSLCGRVPDSDMMRALDLPRFFVLDRRRATLKNLERCIAAACAEFPGEPILVAIDYAQLMDSKEREARMRVADAFAQIDDCAREHKFVALALSQMSRDNQEKARRGEAIGADSATLGAESAAIERFATLTLSIGKTSDREDGSRAVELSVGKARMGKGDLVFPMTYWGKSGLWRMDGDPKSAAAVRESRDVERTEKLDRALEHQIIGAVSKSDAPVGRNQLVEIIPANRQKVLRAIAKLVATGDLVEVARHAPRSRSWMLWTPDRARDAGAPLVRDTLLSGTES